MAIHNIVSVLPTRFQINMLPQLQYELLDFGEGRRLERVGQCIVDRPCPAAEGLPLEQPHLWSSAQGYFNRTHGLQGDWKWRKPPPVDWSIAAHPEFRLELRATPAGQVGVFPEQADNWRWVNHCIRDGGSAADPLEVPDIRVLNLFAYTGGSTLAAAQAGATVVHLDGARNVVQWARDNARLSNMADHPIRWICEDARKFVSRELKRGNRYDGIILDPPSYGHGPKRQSWSIDDDLLDLWSDCRQLLTGQRPFLLLSCHSPNWTRDEFSSLLIPSDDQWLTDELTITPNELLTRDGRKLPSGISLRWRGTQRP